MIHILNGDSLLAKFPEKIQGDKITIREALIDGPIKAGSLPEFWKERQHFVSQRYPESTLDYFSHVQSEFEKITALPSDSGVCCWFENDLFCQVNFWFVMSLLVHHPGETYLALPVSDLKTGFGGTEEDILASFENSVVIHAEDRWVFGQLWKYFSDQEVFEATTLAERYNSKFPFLLPAVEAWRDSIPLGDYPGRPKATLMEIRQELETDDFKLIFKEFRDRLPIYGYGDLQVLNMGKELGFFSR